MNTHNISIFVTFKKIPHHTKGLAYVEEEIQFGLEDPHKTTMRYGPMLSVGVDQFMKDREDTIKHYTLAAEGYINNIVQESREHETRQIT